jgi:hypothetical protein
MRHHFFFGAAEVWVWDWPVLAPSISDSAVNCLAALFFLLLPSGKITA